MAGFSIWHWVITITVTFLVTLPFWKIAKKAGYSGWWSLWVLVPFANFIWLYVLAFSKWPSSRE